MLPLLALSLSFTAGIWLASFIVRPMAVWLVLAAIGFLLLVLNPLWDWLFSRAGRWLHGLRAHVPAWVRLPAWVHRRGQGETAPGGAGQLSNGVLLVLCLVALCLGAARYQAAQPTFSEADLAWYNESSPGTELVGVAFEPPDVRDTHIQVLISAEQIILPEGDRREVTGRVLVYLPTGGKWHYGDRLRVSGQLQTPPAGEEFSYQAYLARQSVYSYMPYASAVLVERGGGNGFLRAIYAFRETGLRLIYHYLPDPEASLLAGIVLGVESGIPEDVDQAFKDTGTTHIIAISGFNITIVAGLFSILFGRLLGPRRGAVAAVVAISLYTVMVGADAAVVRAAIMGGLSLFAGQVGRRQHGLNSLGVTAGLMLLFNPMTLWDVGFQLSFAATLGLIVYAGPWEERFESWLAGKINPQLARRLTGPVSEYVLLTLAAQLTTLPLIVYHFKRLSLVSLPANIAILPAQPPVMVLGGLAVLVGSVLAPVGQVLAYAVWPFTAFTIRAVEWFARWDGGVRVLGPVSPLAAAGFYLLLLLLTLYWGPIKAVVKKNLRPVLVLGMLGVAAVLVWQAALSRPDGKLHLTMLDVGGGEAFLIQTPEGRYLLIGGGESASDLSEGLGRSLPFFHRRLDVLVVAGTEADQLNALPSVLPRYVPAEVWWAGEHDASRPARQVYAWAQAQGLAIQPISPGQVLDLGSGVRLQAVGLNEKGAVLRLSWGEFACLLPFTGIEVLAEDPTNVSLNQNLTALLLARSGEIESNPPAWLAQTHPQVALLSVDSLNRSGLPDVKTLQALAGIPLLRTDLNGSVELVTDGEQLWVYAEK
jgi:competence protein ComEC